MSAIKANDTSIACVFIFSYRMAQKQDNKMTTVSLYRTQVDRSGAKVPSEAPCACFQCSAFSRRVECPMNNGVRDWELDQVSCCGGLCTAQPTCMHASTKDGDIGMSTGGKNPVTGAAFYGRAPQLAVTYDLKYVDTVNQLRRVHAMYGQRGDNSTGLLAMASQFCSVPVKNGDGSIVSRINDPNSDDWCSKWYHGLSPSDSDAFIQRYCTRNPTSKDCACAMRSRDPLYDKVKAMKVFNDGCWYSPCADSVGQLLPNAVRNPTCPSNVCQVAYQIIDTGSVTIEDVKNIINCNFDDYKPKPDPPKPDPPKPDPPKPDPPKPDQPISTKVMVALVILAIVLVIAAFA
ncbi:hypothetical protein [Red seabream iridovirus]|nr:hypothetical protein [Red seabream iridovirus]